jgi:hypothetical protein
LLYKNLGAAGNYAFEEVSAAGLENISNESEKCYRYVAVGDYDNDGFADILQTGQNRSGVRRTSLYKNDKGSGQFILQESLFNGHALRPFSSGSVAFGDMDGDGYLDILSTGYGDPFESDPTEKGGFRVYKNNGDGTFTALTFDEEEWGTFLGQCSWADVNNDGFLDFIITGKYRKDSNQDINQAKIYINDGAGQFVQKRSADANLEPLNVSGTDWADMNNDGYIDLVMNGSGNTSSGKTWVYLNDGSGVFYPYQNAIAPVRTSATAVGDYDKDGFADVFICGYRDGSGGGSTAEVWKNEGGYNIQANMPPAAPSNLKAEQAGDYTLFSWDAPSDDFTPQAALRYNVYVTGADNKIIQLNIPADIDNGFVKVSDISPALTATGYRMKLPDGNYTFGVQAIDNGKSGGSFATQTFSAGASGVPANPMHSIKVHSGVRSLVIDAGSAEGAVSVCSVSGVSVYASRGLISQTVSELPAGVYVVKISSTTGTIIRKATVK